MKNNQNITNCIACGNKNINRVLNLGEQPLANSYIKNLEDSEKKYPLELCKCQDCHHLQLSYMVNPDEIFKNYLYISGTAQTHLKYFEWFANLVKDKVSNKNPCILDIGCNDGSQLNFFKSLGFDTYGIDPAQNLYEYSSKNHKIFCDYFNEYEFEKDTCFDAIICQNAFSHNYDQFNFLLKVKNLLSNNGLFFVTCSQVNMIENNEFDTIYHEHLSFYCVNSMNSLCKRVGLNLIDVIIHPIHGNSYIFVISKNKSDDSKILSYINKEKNLGLYENKIYENYSKNAIDISNQFSKKIKDFKKQGYTIVGYGSPAKANTFLNFINCKEIEFIIDDNPLKQGLFTPGTHIKIVNKNILNLYENVDKLIFIPLAWNFFEEIKNNIIKIRKNKNDIYLTYFENKE